MADEFETITCCFCGDKLLVPINGGEGAKRRKICIEHVRNSPLVDYHPFQCQNCPTGTPLATKWLSEVHSSLRHPGMEPKVEEKRNEYLEQLSSVLATTILVAHRDEGTGGAEKLLQELMELPKEPAGSSRASAGQDRRDSDGNLSMDQPRALTVQVRQAVSLSRAGSMSPEASQVRTYHPSTEQVSPPPSPVPKIKSPPWSPDENPLQQMSALVSKQNPPPPANNLLVQQLMTPAPQVQPKMSPPPTAFHLQQVMPPPGNSLPKQGVLFFPSSGQSLMVQQVSPPATSPPTTSTSPVGASTQGFKHIEVLRELKSRRAPACLTVGQLSVCKICDKRSSAASETAAFNFMINHLYSHLLPDKKVFTCGVCPHGSAQKQSLVSHIVTTHAVCKETANQLAQDNRKVYDHDLVEMAYSCYA